MDEQKKIMAMLISNAIIHSKTMIDVSTSSNFSSFVSEISGMLAGVYAALNLAHREPVIGHDDIYTIEEQVNILRDNFMRVLFKALEDNKK